MLRSCADPSIYRGRQLARGLWHCLFELLLLLLPLLPLADTRQGILPRKPLQAGGRIISTNDGRDCRSTLLRDHPYRSVFTGSKRRSVPFDLRVALGTVVFQAHCGRRLYTLHLLILGIQKRLYLPRPDTSPDSRMPSLLPWCKASVGLTDKNTRYSCDAEACKISRLAMTVDLAKVCLLLNWITGKSLGL